MKKSIKKAAALGLTAAMTAGLMAGCGSAPSTAASSQASSATAAAPAAETGTPGEYTDYSAGFPEKVTIQIPVYDRGFEGWDPTNNYYTQWVQKEFGDKYNVNVQYVAISRSNEVQDFMQLIAAHTAPDIIFHYDMPAAVNYYGQGAMQDIDYDELAFYAPTYYANMKDTIDSYGTLDGHQAFIFAERTPIYYNWVTLIRKDWCDQVGMDLPTNNDELDALVTAWKEAGLGTLNEPLITKSFTYEYGWIDPASTDDEKALYLDLNVAPFTWSASENFLKDMNAKFNAGLIDPEFYLTTDDTLAKGKFVSGQVGTYSLYMASGTDVFDSLKANDPNAEVAVMPDTVATGFKPYFYKNPAYGMIMGISTDTPAIEREAVYMFLDWMSDPANLTYLQHGVEGESYTVDADGIATQVADYSGEAKLSNNNNKDYWCLVQEVMTYGDEATNLKANKINLAPAGYDYLIQDSYDLCKAKEDCGIISPIFTKTVESLSEYTTDLGTLWQEAYVACITCKPEEFDATYADYKEEYLDAGYQEILDEKQSLIDAGDVIVIK